MYWIKVRFSPGNSDRTLFTKINSPFENIPVPSECSYFIHERILPAISYVFASSVSSSSFLQSTTQFPTQMPINTFRNIQQIIKFAQIILLNIFQVFQFEYPQFLQLKIQNPTIAPTNYPSTIST
jgi:hypothetical protein